MARELQSTSAYTYQRRINGARRTVFSSHFGKRGKPMNKKSPYPLSERLSYWFDNRMSQGLWPKVRLLLIVTLIFIVVIGSIAAVANGIENNEGYKAVKAIAESENAGVLPICAQIEADIAEMDKEEKEMFLSDMGLEESGLDRLIRECYSLLGLISYLTAGKPEVRAWTIKKGTKAPQAAGKIHSDFERGFIRAEVIAFDDLMKCGSMTAAKEKGLVRSEGKEYVMKDGDIVLFRFNV